MCLILFAGFLPNVSFLHTIRSLYPAARHCLGTLYPISRTLYPVRCTELLHNWRSKIRLSLTHYHGINIASCIIIIKVWGGGKRFLFLIFCFVLICFLVPATRELPSTYRDRKGKTSRKYRISAPIAVILTDFFFLVFSHLAQTLTDLPVLSSPVLLM